jgi:putative transposase
MGRGVRLKVAFTVADRLTVRELLDGGVQEVRTVLRALALQQLDLGLSTPGAGALVGLSGKTVREIGQRYLEGGLERALFDAPRPGKVPVLDAKQRQQIVALVCSPAPEGRARWTVRLLAEETMRRKIAPTIGREAVRMVLESHDLKPWREKSGVSRSSMRPISRAWKTC